MIGALKESIAANGSKEMAEDFLNCGHPVLHDAAASWAWAHGYSVLRGDPNRPGPKWGQRDGPNRLPPR